MRGTTATFQLPADSGQQHHSPAPTFRGVQSSSSSAQHSSSIDVRAGTPRTAFERNVGVRKRVMTDDQPPSAGVHPVKRLAMKKATSSTPTLGETPT